ncbi:MAG: hypothetical protein M1825_004600 [Sarcosagium campestre]|nr:MAG: hypothetical protein M1825_004600 [Sarcosagium campestre]
MAWQPQHEPLRQLAGFLKDSLSGHDQIAQKQATLMLSQAKTSPDVNNYLTYLFTSRQPPAALSSSVDFHSVRSAAAMMLKNDVRADYSKIPASSLDYIRSSVLSTLQDPNAQIRNFAGNVITEIVRQGGILGWKDLLPTLLATVGDESGNVQREAQEGAMAALVKVCEDNKEVLDKDFQGERPLNVIFLKLLEFTSSPAPKVRAMALSTINIFIPHKPDIFMTLLDPLLERLFQLAGDASADVRRNVCRAFVLIVDVRPDKIIPHMNGLVDYMVSQQRMTDDQELALDAAEFWLCVGENKTLSLSLGPYLPKVIPVLLESMVYSEEDVVLLGGGEDDAEEEDKAEDIRPQFAKAKSTRNAGQANAATDEASATNGITSVQSNSNGEMDDEDDGELSEGEIEEYEDGDEDPEDRWNLRKCSAAALDVLSSVFDGQIFEVTLPYLTENLRHSEWPQREAAVLALGAVAAGCMEVVTPHLPDLVPYLITLLTDDEPVVRQITCWTLGRYSGWAAKLASPEEKARFFEPMMDGILRRMLDDNKKVQEAAASAFANLEERATQALMPYTLPIVHQFVQCFGRYKDRNMFILYDCVQTLAEHVGPLLAKPEVVDLLMPALVDRWNKVSDQSRELFPLLECLSYVATALRNSFAPFAGPLFTRCIRIVHQNLEEYLAAVQNTALDKPDKDFLVTSLDLLSAIIQALESQNSAQLVKNSQPRFFDLLAFCMEDPSNDVRQSSFALLGDCAIFVPDQLEAFLPTLMPIVLKQLNLDEVLQEQLQTGFSVVNNACWSCGEICIKELAPLEEFVEDLHSRLKMILLSPEVPESVHENAAIALGRLSKVHPYKMAPRLGDFAEPFLDAMERVDWTEEKDSAFEGLVTIIAINPYAMESCLRKYFEAIARYKPIVDPDTPRTQRLKTLFSHSLSGFKSMIPDFEGFFGRLDPKDQALIRETYGL